MSAVITNPAGLSVASVRASILDDTRKIVASHAKNALSKGTRFSEAGTLFIIAGHMINHRLGRAESLHPTGTPTIDEILASIKGALAPFSREEQREVCGGVAAELARDAAGKDAAHPIKQ